MGKRTDDIAHFQNLRKRCLLEIADIQESIRNATPAAANRKTGSREQEIARLRRSVTSYENWLVENGAIYEE